jgi:hypothetical protein
MSCLELAHLKQPRYITTPFKVLANMDGTIESMVIVSEFQDDRISQLL